VNPATPSVSVHAVEQAAERMPGNHHAPALRSTLIAMWMNGREWGGQFGNEQARIARCLYDDQDYVIYAKLTRTGLMIKTIVTLEMAETNLRINHRPKGGRGYNTRKQRRKWSA